MQNQYKRMTTRPLTIEQSADFKQMERLKMRSTGPTLSRKYADAVNLQKQQAIDNARKFEIERAVMSLRALGFSVTLEPRDQEDRLSNQVAEAAPETQESALKRIADALERLIDMAAPVLK